MKAVYVHGGVSGLEKPLVDLSAAVAAGMDRKGPLDAIVASVMVLENDPRLNAGYGATLTSTGDIELDAGIAIAGRSGAVAGVRIANPIRLARVVLEDTPHVLLAGPGAERIATGLAPLPATSPEQRDRWLKASAAGRVGMSHYGDPEFVDTVGALALAKDGVVAAGSSTGGVFGKLPGRVGDSPIYGAGFFASKEVAVVGTGVGELFIETSACFRVGAAIEAGADPQNACEEMVATIRGRDADGAAGLMALTSDGRFAAAYAGGSWSVAGPRGPVAAARFPF